MREEIGRGLIGGCGLKHDLELKFMCLRGHEFAKTVQKENCKIGTDGYVHISETCPSCGERQEFLAPLEQFVELLEG